MSQEPSGLLECGGLLWYSNHWMEEFWVEYRSNLPNGCVLIVSCHADEPINDGAEWSASMYWPDGVRGHMGYCPGNPGTISALTCFASMILAHGYRYGMPAN